jgi:hypothetical protein
MRKLLARMSESVSRMLVLHIAAEAGMTSLEAGMTSLEAGMTSLEAVVTSAEAAARHGWAGGHCEEAFPCTDL